MFRRRWTGGKGNTGRKGDGWAGLERDGWLVLGDCGGSVCVQRCTL